MRSLTLLALLVSVLALSHFAASAKKNDFAANVETINDEKDFKKFIRTHRNTLVFVAKDDKVGKEERSVVGEVAGNLKGKASVIYVNCGDKEGAKLCKKMKFTPSPVLLKHFNNDKFNKDYDRAMTVKSLSNFLNDPSGDPMWEEDPAAKDVVHYDDKSFNAMMAKKQKALVMFYAPWCGHCKNLKPTWGEAASELKAEGISTVLAGLDATNPDATATASRYDVKGYPTIIYFENGEKVKTYEGGRDKASIVSFIKDPSAPPPPPPEPEKTWADEEDAQDVLHLNGNTFAASLDSVDSAVVMFYAPWCGHCKRFKPDFSEAATAMKKEGIRGALAAVDCTASDSSQLCKQHGVSGYPTIKHFVKGKVNKDYDAQRTKAALLDFMRDPTADPPPPPPPEPKWSDSGSPVVHLTGDNFDTYLKKKKHALVSFYAPWCGHCKNLKPEFDSAATDMAENKKVAFVGVDCTESSNKDVCARFGVQGFPTIKYFSYGKAEIDYSGGRKKDDLVQFMNDPQPPPPPPPPPKPWSEEGGVNVEHLTDASFLPTVKSKSHTLVMFYAPWCGHCKVAKPEFQAAAAELSDIQSVALAGVDCTLHSKVCQKYDVKGYPTFKYFSGNPDKAEDYNGGRKKPDFISFFDNKKGKQEL